MALLSRSLSTAISTSSSNCVESWDDDAPRRKKTDHNFGEVSGQCARLQSYLYSGKRFFCQFENSSMRLSIESETWNPSEAHLALLSIIGEARVANQGNASYPSRLLHFFLMPKCFAIPIKVAHCRLTQCMLRYVMDVVREGRITLSFSLTAVSLKLDFSSSSSSSGRL